MGKNKQKNQRRKAIKKKEKRRAATLQFEKEPSFSSTKNESKEPIKAKMIKGLTISQETQEQLRTFVGAALSAHTRIEFTVFELRYAQKTIYACLAGGDIVEEQPYFTTPIGKAALEALCSIPLEEPTPLRLQFLKHGKTSLERKIREVLEEVEDQTKICFMGDIAGELDGRIFPLFDWIDD